MEHNDRFLQMVAERPAIGAELLRRPRHKARIVGWDCEQPDGTMKHYDAEWNELEEGCDNGG